MVPSHVPLPRPAPPHTLNTDLRRQLSDTTKSGKLLFPEFALAMYLCNLKLTGKDLPDKIPEKVINEVSSMVDIISFGIPDTSATPETRTNVPNFEVSGPSVATPPVQTQPPQSNVQTLSSLPTGYGFTGLAAQPTGFPGQISPQQRFSPQATGMQGPTQGMQPIPSGLQNQYTGMPPSGGLAPTGLAAISALQSQPTGRPGQWGFVNAPAGSMAGIQALSQQLMPQPGREGSWSAAGLQGNANVPWSITKDEKTYTPQWMRLI
jgi:actin cytoskeleton-regulatory complex protein PAN1